RESIREGLRATFSAAAAVHCVSQAIADAAADFGLDPRKVRIIRPAVDPEVFAPSDARRDPGEPLRIVSTGALHWRKGYEYAFLAVRRLLDRGIPAKLDWIGDGSKTDLQRALFTIDDLGLGEAVRLLGRQPPSEVR